ncbi:MAG TPA: alkaline phosphatase family protein [Trebonia sp.]
MSVAVTALAAFCAVQGSSAANAADTQAAATTAASASALTASATSVAEGSSVTFTYSTPSNYSSTSNWIGWYSSGNTPGNQASTIWKYTQTGTTSLPASGSSPVADGTVTFSTAGLTPGTYTVYFLYNNAYTVIGQPVTIQVTPPAPVAPGTLTASKTSVTAGDQVSFDYAMPSGDVSSSDKIAWFPSGADPTTAAPLYAFSKAASAASGTGTFDTTGLASASYDVYLLASTNAVIAGPVKVAVTNNGPQLPSPGQLPGQPNLIVNGGAELGSATLDGSQKTSVPGWTVNGLINEVQYGAAGGYPAFSSPGSADRDQNFFAAAGGGTSTATQTIDVSKAEGQINQGNVKFNLGGWLGGTGSETDNATVTATFLNASGSSLGTATLGPVTPAKRNNTTELLPENAASTLPKQTTSVRITLTVNGSSGQGYADNLSFTISSDAVPAPALPALPAPETPALTKQSGNPNLIVNGGAEIGDGSYDGVAANTVPGWTTTGLLNEVQYGASDGEGIGGWPTPSTPGPADRGQNFFAGGGGGVSTGTQTIDVSKAEGQINQGKVTYDLSGWLGGTGSETDNASVTATFLSASGDSLGTATLGPVTPAMRDDTTELLAKDATGTLPENTSDVRIVLTVIGNHPANRGGHGQGYADNLSFTISSDRVPAPPSPTQPSSQVPHFDHVFVVMMENQDYSDIIGNTAQAPYLNSLLPKASNLTSMYGLSHPSDENYTALAAGTMADQTGNTQTAENPVQQIGDLVSNAGGTWRTYMQSANGPCDLGSQDTYTIDDTPFHNFKDVADNQAACQEHEQPLPQMAVDLKSADTTPNYAWFSANDCDDMEGCGIAAGDTWLSQTLPEIFNSPAWTQQRSLLIITWDEDAADGQAHLQNIPTLILGSQGTVKAGSTSSHRYTLYSLLRTSEAALNLPSLTGNDYYADPVNDIWTGK